MWDAELLNATLLVTRTLVNLGVPYVIGGSVASMAHGLIRTTLDVDIVADLHREHVSPFVATVSNRFYVDEPTISRRCGKKRPLANGSFP